MDSLDILVEFLFEAHWRTRRFHKAFEKLPIDVQMKATETFKRVKVGAVPIKSLRGGRGKTKSGGHTSTTDLYSVGFTWNGTHYRSIARKLPNGDYQWLWVGTHEAYNNMLRGDRF